MALYTNLYSCVGLGKYEFISYMIMLNARFDQDFDIVKFSFVGNMASLMFSYTTTLPVQ